MILAGLILLYFLIKVVISLYPQYAHNRLVQQAIYQLTPDDTVAVKLVDKLLTDEEYLLQIIQYGGLVDTGDGPRGRWRVRDLPAVTKSENTVLIEWEKQGLELTRHPNHNGQIEVVVYGSRGGSKARITLPEHSLLRALVELGLVRV